MSVFPNGKSVLMVICARIIFVTRLGSEKISGHESHERDNRRERLEPFRRAETEFAQNSERYLRTL